MKSFKRSTDQQVVISLVGDSGDGIQLIGASLAKSAGAYNIDVNTIASYPAEIRAPAGTLPGISGFQLQFSVTKKFTAGDKVDILVAMNPAALKRGMINTHKNTLIIVNSDSFDERALSKAGYIDNPIKSEEFKFYKFLEIPITTLIISALKNDNLSYSQSSKCKNMLAFGVLMYMLSLNRDTAKKWIEEKFKKKQDIQQANLKAFDTGFNFAEISELSYEEYDFSRACKTSNNVSQLTGNEAISVACLDAVQKFERSLLVAGYPITPASSVLQLLSKFNCSQLKVFQAEDEIAAMSAAIGAAYGGSLSVTITSGPGFDLKAEAIGLAVVAELPTVVINVQRSGPSTGMPTKTAQTDLLAAVYGRHGECPVPVVAAASPADCYYALLEAFKISVKYMTPVIFLSDAYLANASESCSLDFSSHKSSYLSDLDNSTRPWILPGTENAEYQTGGLEKDMVSGQISYEPHNHQQRTNVRNKKLEDLSKHQIFKIHGPKQGKILVLTWGSVYGSAYSAVECLFKENKSLSHLHLRHLHPISSQLKTILDKFEKIIIPELNDGQLSKIIQAKFLIPTIPCNKITGQNFSVSELVEFFKKHLGE